MSLPWKRVALVRVPAKPAGIWELAAEYVSGSRLIRFQVVDLDDKGDRSKKFATVWKPTNSIETTADGISAQPNDHPKPESMLTRAARRGALLGKIGGSTADIPDAGATGAPWGTNKKVFAVGSRCILPIAATEGGPLFLTMNDSPESFKDHEGELHVLIEEYPL